MIKKIALIGNPNVGKSTIYNYLTKSRQHTGNWAGKTVENACSTFNIDNDTYEIYDLPGIYSLSAKTEEEMVARNLLLDNEFDISLVVCDATQILRGVNLLLQVMELKNNVALCINLIDEANKKGIYIDRDKLEKIVGVPVITNDARNKNSLNNLKKFIVNYKSKLSNKISYSEDLEQEINNVIPYLNTNNNRWYAIKVLEQDQDIINRINYQIEKTNKYKSSFSKEINDKSINITNQVLKENSNKKISKLDKILTNKLTGIPIMLLLFFIIFWLTINGANYPSDMLYKFFSYLEPIIYRILDNLIPTIILNPLIFGVYRTLTWVVSVMLPPMAIFFPLFSLLESFGILPRIAFNLDKFFQKCNACGKQALTMCMGLGCNAVGVTGCRIIDSKRERLIAIITNSLMPCNGKFSAMISVITMFFIGFRTSIYSSISSSLILVLFILLSIIFTFIVSKILSKTLLKGESSSFILELPAYRKPKILKIIIDSLWEKALAVLIRAIKISAPAGLVIYLFANIHIGGNSLLNICSSFLEPFGTLLGLDGVIILAFIFGLPANEIVIPLIIMGYMSLGNLTDFSNLYDLKQLLVNNGWTVLTALNFLILALFHYPCSTTLLTIKEETKSLKWTLVSFIIPTLIGILLCIFTTFLYKIIV
ncbi:MAG: ferrous iron transport protein B [Bacilli bacterium]|nr:ferrous iron transport protein B [Bacilli bacterium]